jgi:hypothetical protein
MGKEKNMVLKFIKDLMITLAFFLGGFVLIDAIVSHLAFFAGWNLFDNYLWRDVGTLISAGIMYFLVLLYYGYINERMMEDVQNDMEKSAEVIKTFGHERPNSDYPMITDLKIDPLGDQFVSRFRIYLSKTNFILNEVIENSEEECYNASFDLIKQTLFKGAYGNTERGTEIIK